jgi:hypothetical protein
MGRSRFFFSFLSTRTVGGQHFNGTSFRKPNLNLWHEHIDKTEEQRPEHAQASATLASTCFQKMAYSAIHTCCVPRRFYLPGTIFPGFTNLAPLGNSFIETTPLSVKRNPNSEPKIVKFFLSVLHDFPDCI